jgi:hypothetical protein
VPAHGGRPGGTFSIVRGGLISLPSHVYFEGISPLF